MFYSDNPKIVFVSIPKTAGHSIKAYLADHFNAQQVPDRKPHGVAIPSRFSSYYKFTVVRNPFDRAASAWAWRRRHGSGLDLETFLKNPPKRHCQHLFLARNQFDKIIRFENLEKEFSELPFFIEGTTLGWEAATVHECDGNKPRPPTHELITPRIEKLIVEVFANDFEVLGYPKKYRRS